MCIDPDLNRRDANPEEEGPCIRVAMEGGSVGSASNEVRHHAGSETIKPGHCRKLPKAIEQHSPQLRLVRHKFFLNVSRSYLYSLLLALSQS